MNSWKSYFLLVFVNYVDVDQCFYFCRWTYPYPTRPTEPCRLCVTVGWARKGHPLKLPSPKKIAQLGHFPIASQAGRHAGPVCSILYLFFGPTCLAVTRCLYRTKLGCTEKQVSFILNLWQFSSNFSTPTLRTDKIRVKYRIERLGGDRGSDSYIIIIFWNRVCFTF